MHSKAATDGLYREGPQRKGGGGGGGGGEGEGRGDTAKLQFKIAYCVIQGTLLMTAWAHLSKEIKRSGEGGRPRQENGSSGPSDSCSHSFCVARVWGPVGGPERV